MENNVYSQHVHRRENLRDKLSAAATHHLSGYVRAVHWQNYNADRGKAHFSAYQPNFDTV